ncbi:GlxA family transcriptional regulator [Burkholderia ubonensis]|uniref:GlxA family transcriptional regulator n=1 Tax=Burkholderia ubonensis TaxID=101571 RepID=UPI000757A873|nr:GlxA family transcriptional regulator [Burkholderia ubonensis]KVN42808.1 AraC family transcriptional regulator [Burkholderia ubonensis]KWC70292.1 AraC family transcriptional regulator [Burkholderia ubonensis]
MSPDRTASLSHFAFMPLPNFTMIAFTNAIEVLRMANYLSGQPLYRWSVISPEGGPVTASNGLTVDTGPAECAGQPDIVFVCGGVDVQRATTAAHLSTLRRFARSGIPLGSLCTGTYALAKSGLLAGYACAIHWENMSALKEEFPDTRFLKELFVIDRDRITCTGGVAPLDMMLNLIAARVGTARVTQIAEQFIVEHVRDTSAQQRMPLVARLGSANKSLFEVISLMENNIEEPLSREELARLANMSQRQLQRLFREHLGVTPTHYYLTLRLRRARELLLQTDMSIMHITMACGFQSACHFSKSYRDAFGVAPTRERRKQVAPLAQGVGGVGSTFSTNAMMHA